MSNKTAWLAAVLLSSILGSIGGFYATQHGTKGATRQTCPDCRSACPPGQVANRRCPVKSHQKAHGKRKKSNHATRQCRVSGHRLGHKSGNEGGSACPI